MCIRDSRNFGLEGVPVGDADAAHERVRGGRVEVVHEPREHVDGVDDERDGQAEVAPMNYLMIMYLIHVPTSI